MAASSAEATYLVKSSAVNLVVGNGQMPFTSQRWSDALALAKMVGPQAFRCRVFVAGFLPQACCPGFLRRLSLLGTTTRSAEPKNLL